MSEERLQKVLARAGIASRRAAESYILEGRVRVDGRVVRELGTKVGARARVEVDGVRLVPERFVYIVLHKPRGVVSTLRDPEGRPTVAELVKGVGARVVPVGRLDFHTSGALLFTNDGEFAERLLHPKGKVPKEYVAKVRGVVDEAALARWRESIVIDGRATQPADVRLLRVEGDKSWLSIVLHEGRNRQVRRLGEATGFLVMRLARLSHAGITSERLRPGEYRHLSREELIELKQAYGVPRRIHTPHPDEPIRQPARAARTTKQASVRGGQKPGMKRSRDEVGPGRPSTRRPAKPRRVSPEPISRGDARGSVARRGMRR